MDGRYERLKVEHVVGERSVQVVVKDEFTVPEPKPDPEKIISIDKTVKITNVEVIKDKVIIDGQLNLQVVYVAALPDQPVHHTHALLEFTQFVEIPGAEPGMTARASVKVEDIQATVDPGCVGGFEVTAVLQITVKVTETKEINVLVEPPAGVVAEVEKLRVEEVIGEGKMQSVVSGRSKVPPEKPPVDKVLDVDASVTITEKKILDGKVIVEGDIDLQYIYVALEETQPVHHMHDKLHFTQFVEVPGAEEGMHVQVEETITYIGWDVINPETVSVEVIIDKVVKVTQTRELDVVTDIEGVAVEKKSLRVEHVVGEDHVQVVVRDQLEVPPEKPGVVKVLDVKVHKVEVPEEEIVVIKDKVVLSGQIDVQVLYVSEDPDQAVHHTEGVLKFRNFIPIPGAEPDQTVLVNTTVEHVSARVSDSCGKLTIEVVLKLTARVVETIEIEVVVGLVPPEEPCEPGDYLDYVVQPGDTFYKLAKKYNTTVEAIIRANPCVDPYNLQIGTTIKIPCGDPA
ncbi:MAG: LysM-like peptidoglycan-binding protein [Thermoanaerobacterales bacterium 50_218]|nr:MAG: LysM-like peptidoglycan-binding protein [Thermoanaerobacterales bacterium 50_218]HAA89760.1 peptidoglycan-binding protein [Peptococcaceae bacterium]